MILFFQKAFPTDSAAVTAPRITRKRARENALAVQPNILPNLALPDLLVRYQITSWLAPFVRDLQEVKGDGHCGFRAIAVALGRSQDDWPYIRQAMEDTLEKHPNVFTDRTVPDETRTKSLERLRTRQSNVVKSREFWLTMPGWGGVIATTFERPVIYYDSVDGGQTALPYLTAANQNPPIIIACYTQHFCTLSMDVGADFPAPKLDGQWRKLHSDEASDWMTVWGPRIKIGTGLWLSQHNTKGKLTTRSSKRNKKIPSPQIVD